MQLHGRELRDVLGRSGKSRLKLVDEGSALQKVSWQEGGRWGPAHSGAPRMLLTGQTFA